MERTNNTKVYSGIDTLPSGTASDNIVEGCMVLEGGAFRGVYSSGVLDALMEEGINLRCTVGVSAGALNGVNYLSGQIGRSGQINLRYRHDKRYVGVDAIKSNKGIIGFDFVFGKMKGVPDLDKERLARRDREFYVTVTNLNTGRAEYISKDDQRNFFKGVQASASMPFVSRPVRINDRPYLDGGCACKIPYAWALEKGFEKIVIIRTRSSSFRKKVSRNKAILPENIVYYRYPQFAKALKNSPENYNRQCDEIEKLKEEGRIFVISPSENIEISRLEGDMEKLGGIYWLGYNDAKANMDELKKYLGID